MGHPPQRSSSGRSGAAAGGADGHASGRFFLQPLEAPPPPPGAALLLDEVEVDGGRFRLYRRLDPEPVDPTQALTRREFEIVRRVCLGEPNKRIADRLGISEYTVKTYIKQIFIKLDVHTRSAMVYRCAPWVGAAAGPLDAA